MYTFARFEQAIREALLAIDGVNAVQIRPYGTDAELLSVECQVDVQDGVEAAIARVVAPRWSLHRLERQQPTLENIFLRYVSSTAPAGDTAAEGQQ